LELLFKFGGSSAGARPMVLINIEGAEWLIKLRSPFDPKNIGQIEYEYSLLSKDCGIQMLDDKWKLSPAYDLLPGSGFNGFHTTTIAGKGDPNDKDIESVADRVGLNRKDQGLFMK